MWGQAQGAAVFFRDDGIIPTRVGTRHNNPKFGSQLKDHPHACGDKVKPNFCVAMGGGSSPRVWGQAVGTASEFTLTGIIPTRVGTRLA